MVINYYSNIEHDWRLDIKSAGFSFLEIVGSKNIKGTFKHTKENLKVEKTKEINETIK